MAWEAVALDLAERCGLRTPPRRLVEISGRHVLLVERFDRRGEERVGYVSGMTLLRSRDGTTSDYLELAEKVTEHSPAARDDLHELWRRVAFSMAINNTDDHMRNHGFLRLGPGWRLSPLFDVNPDPDRGKARATTIGFTDADEAAALIDVAPHFDLRPAQAQQEWEGIRAVVASWRQVAVARGVPARELDMFADALDG